MIAGLFLLAAASAAASSVRTLGVNNGSMAPVYLRMGKSTVLRFTEKPKKVVIGNQNYYGLEFIENDVAIQPLGSVATNLFVYTENHTYGFLLTPGERYDDLVFVRWRYGVSEGSPKSPPPATKITYLKSIFLVGKDLKITVAQIQGPSTFGLHIIDCEVENLGKTDISNIVLRAMRDGKALDNQSTVLGQERLKPREKTRARIVLKLGAKANFYVEGKTQSAVGKILISRKSL